MIKQQDERFSNDDLIAYQINSGDPHKMPQAHFHQFFELVFILNSTTNFNIIIENDTLSLKNGQLAILPPFVIHNRYSSPNEDIKRFILYFKEDILLPQLKNKLVILKGKFASDKILSDKISDRLFLIAKEINTPSEFHDLNLESSLHELLLFILGYCNFYDSEEAKGRINDVINYINENYQEEITTSTIADEFYINPSYLCRQFKQNTGRTISEYINVTRIAKAQHFLNICCNPITEIGSSCGFSNPTHFYRMFKKYTGLSPSEYRKLGQRKMDTSLNAEL